MHSLIAELVRHKWYANAALLNAVRGSEAAANDEPLRTLFHHILIANRFWLFLVLNRGFDPEQEARIPAALDPLIARFRETEALELEWLSSCAEDELERRVETPRLPGHAFTVGQAMMQACMHSHGHRAQAAVKLRALGGAAPPTDFVLWVMDRPAAAWPV